MTSSYYKKDEAQLKARKIVPLFLWQAEAKIEQLLAVAVKLIHSTLIKPEHIFRKRIFHSESC